MCRYWYSHGWWEGEDRRDGGCWSPQVPKISLTWKCRPGSLDTAIHKALSTDL